MITSTSNPRVKEAIKLRKSRDRRASGRFLIDGRREIGRAFDAGIRLLHVFHNVESFLEKDTDSQSGRLGRSEAPRRDPEATRFFLQVLKVPIVPVSAAVFRKIAFGDRDEGLVAVAAAEDCSLQAFENKMLEASDLDPEAFWKRPLLLAVIEGVEKPGNLGAVFRAADGAGLDGVILADPCCDLYHPHAIRASLGTLFSLPVAVAESQDVLNWLQLHGITIAAARCDGAIPYERYDFRQPTAILLGSEAYGLSDHWTGNNIQPIRLPMNGAADSLNVATTGAILFYHAILSRGATETT